MYLSVGKMWISFLFLFLFLLDLPCTSKYGVQVKYEALPQVGILCSTLLAGEKETEALFHAVGPKSIRMIS